MWHDVLMIYPQSMYVTVTRIYIPLMKSAVVSSLISASSLAFKVGVMQKYLGASSNGYWSADSVGKIGYRSSQCYGMDDLVDSYCICI